MTDPVKAVTGEAAREREAGNATRRPPSPLAAQPSERSQGHTEACIALTEGKGDTVAARQLASREGVEGATRM